MKLVSGHLRLSASDITSFAACPHKTALEAAVAHDTRPDFLLRVPSPRGTWPWSYEPADAKLALTARVHADEVWKDAG
jgi:hypothetical protein